MIDFTGAPSGTPSGTPSRPSPESQPTDDNASSITNIADHLGLRAQQHPHTAAVIFPEGRNRNGRVTYSHYTYAQLHQKSDEIARGLQATGIGRGCRTVLMVRPSLDFFALTFALFKVGAVPVLIDPGLGLGNVAKCLDEAQPEAFIGIGKAQLARQLFGWGRRTVRTSITVGQRSLWGGIGSTTLHQIERRGRDSDAALTRSTRSDMAAILFTSGSTGIPKGAVYTHGNFIAQVKMLRQLYGIQPGERDLPTFPLFALFAPALGMTAVIPDMDPTRPAQADPRKLIEAIEDFGCSNMFGSPALLDTLSRYAVAHGVKLPSLRRVLSAGAPVHANILERMSHVLREGVQVYTPYGATESLPVCSIGSHEILTETSRDTARGSGVCVGRPVAGAEVKILTISDDRIDNLRASDVVDDGEIGEIIVCGDMVTESYFNRDAHTRLAKIQDSDGRIWHRMGDLGYFDPQGRLWFCGRKTHRVQRQPDNAKSTLFTIPCEGIFNQHPAVYRSALVGLRHAGGAQTPAICVELESGTDTPHTTLRQELLTLGSRCSITRDIRHIFFHPSFPVDIRHNAKIFREKLADWACRQSAGKGLS